MTAARILVVEDEAILAGDLADQLTELGYAVVGTADTAEAAVRLAGERSPDLVFMDIRLRGPGDGITAAGEIRRRYGLPVVFLTAHSDRDTLDRAKATGPFGYVHKPWDARDLRTAVELALANHRAGCRLRESEELYRATVQSVGDGIIAVDAGGRVTVLNPVAERMTGWTKGEAVGLPFGRVFHLVGEKDGVPVVNPLEEAIRTGVPAVMPAGTALVARDGRRVPVEDTATAITGPAGESAGAVVVFRDVSASRKAEAALREAQKLESIGVLAGGLAHDFNNLLTPVLGYAELLRSRVAADPAAAAMIEEIVSAARRAAHLTRQMLAYAGKGRLGGGPLDLSALVGDMTPLLGAAVSKKASLTFDLTPGLAVDGDAAQLRQVVLNLVTNASEALGEGAGTVRVRTRAAAAGAGELESPFVVPPPPPGKYVVLEVSDTGCGMDEQTLARSFEPYFTTKFTGRGLGLSALLGIVRGHGGTLKVTTAVGRGTVFAVYLPASPTGVPAAPTTPVADAGRGRAAAGTVLVADDDPGVLLLVEKTLAADGFGVVTAADGRAAVELFRERGEGIDLVLLDQMMPRLTGVEAIAEMRAVRPNLPAVLMTGYAPQEVADEFPDARLGAIVQKPFRSGQLVSVLREVLGRVPG